MIAGEDAAAGARIGEAHLRYRRDIDGLRALAVLPVLAFHAFPHLAPGGFVGVDIFFVISGYLISRIVLTGLGDGTFSFANFYAHRARRIFPSLVVILIAALGIGWIVLLPDDFAALGKHVVAGAGFVSNLLSWHEAGYFDAASDTKPLLHLWSLGIEEQFYIVWPLLLFAAARLDRRRAILAGVIAATVALSLVFSLFGIRHDATMAFYSPLPRAWELGIGALLACRYVWSQRRDEGATVANANIKAARSRWGRADLASVAGFAMIVFAIAFIDRGRAFPGWWALLPTLGSASLIGAGPQAWINRHVLSNRGLVLIGLVSYQLYLWHWPLLVYTRISTAGAPSSAQLAIALLASFPLAWATYRWIDLPMRRGRRKFTKAVVAWIALAAVALAGTTILSTKGMPSRFPEAARALAAFHYDYAPAYREGTCFLRPEQTISAWRDCTTQGAKGAPSVWLWGDSHAAHLYPGLRVAQESLGFSLTQITASLCPPILDFDPPDRPNCRAINDMAIREMTEHVPDTIIVAARWNLYDWRRIADTIERLHDVGVGRVIVIGPVPIWQGSLPRLLATEAMRDPLHHVPLRIRKGVDAEAEKLDLLLHRFVDGLPATYVSAYRIFCDDQGCLARTGNASDSIVSWGDTSHLTTAGSDFLVSHLPASLLVSKR